jgi:hypothetical protein
MKWDLNLSVSHFGFCVQFLPNLSNWKWLRWWGLVDALGNPELGVANTCRQSDLLNKFLMLVEIGLALRSATKCDCLCRFELIYVKAHNDFGS